MSDRVPSLTRARALVAARRALLLGGVAVMFVPVVAVLVAPLCSSARAASLPPVQSSSSRFT